MGFWGTSGVGKGVSSLFDLAVVSGSSGSAVISSLSGLAGTSSSSSSVVTSGLSGSAIASSLSGLILWVFWAKNRVL